MPTTEWMRAELPNATYRADTPITALADWLADPVAPANFPESRLRFRNDRWAARVGLADLRDEAWLRHFGRFEPLAGNLPCPLALRYHGHQFRVYNPQLGDGRGFLYAQLRDDGGRLLELGTKGSGRTPWSRDGDGRLTLKGAVREVLAGAVLNDIGPVVETAGLARIKAYLGQGRSFATWMHAARALEELHGESHPSFTLDDWLVMAKRGMTLCSNGRIAFDYDMKIAEPILAADDKAVPPDMWPLLAGLADKPVLLVRGGLSALLSAETLARMQEALPRARAVTVPDAGHAPTLDEPAVRTAIDALLAEVA